jgi:hypothetical protein
MNERERIEAILISLAAVHVTPWANKHASGKKYELWDEQGAEDITEYFNRAVDAILDLQREARIDELELYRAHLRNCTEVHYIKDYTDDGVKELEVNAVPVGFIGDYYLERKKALSKEDTE